MKKHALQQYLMFPRLITALMLLMSLVSLAGCGNGNPNDSGLDRVPNVPASTRAAEGATVADPSGR